MDRIKLLTIAIGLVASTLLVGYSVRLTFNRNHDFPKALILLDEVSNLSESKPQSVSELELMEQYEAEFDAIYEAKLLEKNSIDFEQVVETKSKVRTNQKPEETVALKRANLESENLLSEVLLSEKPQPLVAPSRPVSQTMISSRVVVMDINGDLQPGFAYEEDCDVVPCKQLIVNTDTDKVIWDGHWAAEYLPTFNGKQVIKVAPTSSVPKSSKL